MSDRDIARARAQLRKRLGGNIIVTEASDEIRFETEASIDEMSLRMAGNGSQVFMVAGARYWITIARIDGLSNRRFGKHR